MYSEHTHIIYIVHGIADIIPTLIIYSRYIIKMWTNIYVSYTVLDVIIFKTLKLSYDMYLK